MLFVIALAIAWCLIVLIVFELLKWDLNLGAIFAIATILLSPHFLKLIGAV